ncbi:hypothetical protein [Flagellimonas amoyensis]|uniref:hypothetical protein n=1 Tax=Flagellimonas amoyensis TaxID=2169401 RepID=UPI000D34C77C|nr:hypothetical protein [Allomuricauda amoyensis]
MKLKSIEKFQSENVNSVLAKDNLSNIAGGAMAPSDSIYSVGECTAGGYDCVDLYYWDDHTYTGQFGLSYNNC